MLKYQAVTLTLQQQQKLHTPLPREICGLDMEELHWRRLVSPVDRWEYDTQHVGGMVGHL